MSRRQCFALSVLSGCLLALAWFGLSGLFLLFSFVPLLIVENHLYKSRSSNLGIVFWPYAFVALIVWNILTTWWVGYATLGGAILAIILNSLLMSLVWWLFHEFHRRKGDLFGYLFLFFCWTSLEFLQYNWDLLWPMLNLGNGLSKDIFLIQWYEYTGVLGGTWWILISNILLAKVLDDISFGNGSTTFLRMSSTAVVILFPILISIFIFYNYHEKNDPVQVVLLQPNIDPYTEKFEGMSSDEQYQRLFQLADSVGNAEVDFFLAPETAFHDVWLDSLDSNRAICQTQKMLSEKFPKAAFITGAMTYLEYTTEKGATPTARALPNTNHFFDAFNSALFIEEGKKTSVYHKSLLVSGVEKLPFKKYIGFLEPFLANIGGTTGTLGRSNHPDVFVKDSIVVGVPICFESIFGEYVSGFVKRGASLLFVITNDGWWKNSPGGIVHLTYSQALAISHRRSIARAGNTGISCIINQKGEIESETKWWTETALRGEVNQNRTITFYSKMGDFLGKISSFVMLIMVLILLIDVKRKNRINPN